MSTALIPIKGLVDSKSRLAPALPRERLRELSLAMLTDAIEALRATPSVERVVVATPDAEVGRCAEDAGARALVRSDAGLNPAIDAARDSLSLAPDEAWLVMLGDVAGARAEDLEKLHGALDELGRPGAAWAPSRDGGTSVLLRSPADSIPSRFGAQSAARHREAADAAGVPWKELPLPSLGHDLDCEEDLELFLSQEGDETGGRRTAALLRTWGLPRGTR